MKLKVERDTLREMIDIEEDKMVRSMFLEQKGVFSNDTLSLAIDTLSEVLDSGETVKFTYNKLVYEIFESIAEDGFVVNLYSNNTKDSDGYYLDHNLVDGGICTGEATDAIEFMM